MESALVVLAIVASITATASTQTRANSSDKSSQSPAVITDPAQLTATLRLDVQPLTIEKLYMTRAIGDGAWSPEGRQIAFVANISGRDNLWVIDSAGGWPTQLTVSNQRQVSPAWSPNGNWIAYASDYDGNEQWDIFLVSPKNGQVINLSNTPDISEENPVWSPDGGRLAYSIRAKNATSSEIETIDIGSKTIVHITTNAPKEHSNGHPLWSRDGKEIVYTQTDASFKDSSIFVADALTGRTADLTPHEGEKTFAANDISPDGKTLLITSNAGNGYNNVALLDRATRKLTWLTQDKWEVDGGCFSANGKAVTWTANIDGNTNIFTYDLGSRQTSALPLAEGTNILAGATTAFSHDGRLLFAHEAADAPNDLWVYDSATQKLHQVTHALVGGVRSDDMVRPVLVHYPSKDGKWQISAYVYVPYNAERNGQNAAVVMVHGGPNAQYGNYLVRSTQYLVNQGFFVIAPNFRGSSGYGKEFEDASRFDMGGGDLQDVVAAADWITKTGFVDPKKIAVMGGSYGGYLSLMAVTKMPERWAAAATWSSFVNLFTEIENADPAARQHAIATMGDPMKDKELLKDRSPIYFVDSIKAPVLLLAGGKDPRCPPTEAEQVAQAIRKRNGVVELKIYENEGHGFSKVENQIDAITRIADFLKKYAPPAKCGCSINE